MGCLVVEEIGSFVLWNVAPAQNDYVNQTGSVSFVASNSAPWAGSQIGGVLAEFVFTVQPGAGAQAFWPIRLQQVEVRSPVLGTTYYTGCGEEK
jgi:hypothetical protein